MHEHPCTPTLKIISIHVYRNHFVMAECITMQFSAKTTSLCALFTFVIDARKAERNKTVHIWILINPRAKYWFVIAGINVQCALTLCQEIRKTGMPKPLIKCPTK